MQLNCIGIPYVFLLMKIFQILMLIKFQIVLKNFMRLLLISNYNHKASKQLVKFLKEKKIRFSSH